MIRRPLISSLALALALSLAAGCSKPPPEFAEVPSAESLYRDGLETLEGRQLFFGLLPLVDYQKAIDTFQAIVDNYPYSEYAVLAELKIADTYYAQEKWEEAVSYYRDFSELHPNHELVPYSIYRSGLCRYRQSRKANRDQTDTKQAIAHLEHLLRRYPHSNEAREAETLWLELRGRLANHEMQVADYYLDRDEFQSAADRYRKVLDQFPGLGYDGQALYKLGVCYSNMNLEDEATRIFEVILDNYDGTEYADAARDFIPAAQ